MRQFYLSIFLLLLGYTPVQAQGSEYHLKAAMLFNFALLVEWPAAAFSSPGSPFVVCVVGADPFGPWLKGEMGERIGGHPVEIRHVENLENVRPCHLVFISKSEQNRLKEVLMQLKDGHALTVGDTNRSRDFCREGGMIALTTEGSKVRFELNSNAAARAGLGINSKIKRVAHSTSCGGS